MTPTTTTQTRNGAPTDARAEAPGAEPIASERAGDVFSRISAIAGSGASITERAQALSSALLESYEAVAVQLIATVGGEEIDRFTPGHHASSEAWAATLHPLAIESNAHGTRVARVYADSHGSPSVAVLAAPIAIGDREPFGAVSLACACTSRAQAERLLVHLRAACAQAANALAPAPTPDRAGVRYEDLSRVFSKAGEYKSLTQFAFAATNAIRAKLGCEIAAFGTVERGKVDVRCVSGLDEVKRNSPGVHRIQQAMGECADRAASVVCQPGDRWSDAGGQAAAKLHERWRSATGGACVASVPVTAGDRVVAVLSLRRPEDRHFTAGEIETAERMVQPLAGAIPLVAEATRPALSRARKKTAAAVRWAATPGSWGGKLLIAAGLALAAWIAFGESVYRVTVPAAVVAEREHAVSAPFAGRLSEVLVTPGERVSEGQVIARMDTADLRLELREIEATLERLDADVRAAAGAGEASAAAVAAADASAMRSRRDLLRERIAAAEITAPCDGIVSGDKPEDLAGSFLATGDPLLTIGRAFGLELRVNGGSVTDVAEGARVDFKSNARPESAGRTRLGKVTPVATEFEGRRVFLAEAPLPDDQPWLRPGMEGVAMVEVGDRANWWIATHRVLDAARVNFWIE